MNRSAGLVVQPDRRQLPAQRLLKSGTPRPRWETHRESGGSFAEPQRPGFLGVGVMLRVGDR